MDVILFPERSSICNLLRVYRSEGIKWIYRLLRSNLISLDRFALRNNNVNYAMFYCLFIEWDGWLWYDKE